MHYELCIMNRVLHIYTTPPYKVGGIMTILSAYKEHAALFHEHGYEYERLDIPYRTHIWSPVDNLIYIITQQLAVARRLWRGDVSVVHIHTSRGYLFAKDMLLSLFIHFLFRIPVCMTVHMASMSAIFNRIGWMKCVSRWIMNHCIHRIFCLSEATRSEFVQSGVNEDIAEVLYNFHNLKHYPSPLRQAQDRPSSGTNLIIQRQSTSLGRVGVGLLFVGALCERKGILDLLEACSKLTDIDFKLNVCGNVLEPVVEDKMNEYAAVLDNKLAYHGVKCGEELTRLYREADIFILPSYSEGMPMVVLEAASEGCAIICTPVGGTSEILTDDNVIWVTPGKTDEIASAIRSLASDHDRLERMKTSNKVLSERFTINNHICTLCSNYGKTFHF